jgi:hypothetical protein
MPTQTGYWNKDEAAGNHDFSEALAQWIGWYLPKEQKIIDFGCGNGKYVSYLKDHDITGIEGDGSTVTETKKFIEQDLTKPFKIECVNAICLEVGEHIPAEFEQRLIDNLTNAKNKIILSWATPGQAGYYHVNCQSNEWVIKQMKQRGFHYLKEDSELARDIVEDRFKYFKNTIMIFQSEQGVLDELGRISQTDKSSDHHDYCKVYESYLSSFKYSNVSVIEIGVGGYEFTDRGGQSLRMWYQYFPNGKIIGIDIYKKEGIINDRTEFWQGSQTDENLMKTIIDREENAEIRIVIDDASHVNKLTIETFKKVFPMLKSGDLYFVEDVHTSYWEDHFSGNEKPGAKSTTMGFFTELTHQLNHETIQPKYKNMYAGKIEFIHFYKEMIVIKKL